MYKIPLSKGESAKKDYLDEFEKDRHGHSYISQIQDNLDDVKNKIKAWYNSDKQTIDAYVEYIDEVKKNLKKLLVISYKDMKGVKNHTLEQSNELHYFSNNNLDMAKDVVYKLFDKNGTILKNDDGSVKTETKKFHDLIVDALKYNKARNVMRKIFKDMNINACVYCNAQYLLTYEHNNEKKSTLQVDHFFDKSKFPCFASSFYNFQPSCPYCNQKKSDNEVLFYMYDNGESEKNPFKFEANDKDLSNFLLQKGERIEIEFKKNESCTDELFENHKERFHIKEMYNENFAELVKKIVVRRLILSEDYRNSLLNSYTSLRKDLNMNYNEVLYGFIDDPERIHEEPLSKLKQDIFNQLK